MAELTTPAQADTLHRKIGSVAAAKRPERTVGAFAASRQDDRVYDCTLVPVYTFDGEVELVAVLARDVTDEQRAQAELQLRYRRKEEFIALLAHELRNPLAPLRNGLQIMKLAPNDSEAVAKARSLMDRQLDHLARLIDDLLDVSRITRNKLDLRLEDVLLTDAVADAVDSARPLIESAGHELSVVLPAEPVVLQADATRLAQILLNLLTNAAKYMQPGGKIELTASQSEDEIEIIVADTGIGIAEEAIPHIFDIFTQGERGKDVAGGGLGVGLALVKGLVEMHGGSVEAESDGPAQGSRFTVRLPLPAERAHCTPMLEIRDGVVARGHSRRVLVVDDNEDLVTSAALMLERLGHKVFTALDGFGALDVAERHRPDIIFMDIGMPRLDGLEAVRRLRQEPWGKDIPVVALTGWGQDKDRVESKAAGCQGHLVKPVKLEDVQDILQRIAIH